MPMIMVQIAMSATKLPTRIIGKRIGMRRVVHGNGYPYRNTSIKRPGLLMKPVSKATMTPPMIDIGRSKIFLFTQIASTIAIALAV